MSGQTTIDADQGRKPQPLDSRTIVARKLRAAEKAKPVPVVETTPERIVALEIIRSRHRGTSTDAQMHRMLDAMRELGDVTVPEARRHLLVSHPAQCVLLLRREVCAEVLSEDVRYVDEGGDLRTTARYSLPHE